MLVIWYYKFVDTMKVLVNYACTFNLEYDVKFVEVNIKDMLRDKFLSEYPPSRTCATHSRYVRFARFLVKEDELLPLFERLSTEGRTGKELAITYLDGSVL